MQESIQKTVREAIFELSKCNTKRACIAIWEQKLDKIKNYKGNSKETPSTYTIKKAVSSVRTGIKKEMGVNEDFFKALRKKIAEKKKLNTKENRVKWLLYDAVKGLDGVSNQSLGIVSVGIEIAKENKELTSKSLHNKLSNKNTVHDMSGMIKTAERLLKSWDWKCIATALCLVTGRRTIEVVQTGNFSVKKGCFMSFSGQAKTKDDKRFMIPVLVSPSKVRKAVKRLRELKPELATKDAENVNGLLANSIKRVCKKQFKGMTSVDTTAHDLRKIYTRYCISNFMGSNEIQDGYGNIIRDERLFVKAILGHDNTQTGLHYENWLVSN